MPAKIIAVKSLKVVKVKKKDLINIRFQKFLHFKIFYDEFSYQWKAFRYINV